MTEAHPSIRSKGIIARRINRVFEGAMPRAVLRATLLACCGLVLRAPAVGAIEPETATAFPVTLTRDSGEITMTFRDLPVGLYSFYLYGTIAPAGRAELQRIWKPTPMQFEVRNADGKRVCWGRRLLKQSFATQRMQGFHLQAPEPDTYTVTFRLLPSAQESAVVERIDIVDQLAGLPSEAIKRSQNLEPLSHTRLPALTEERLARDRAIWEALPPLNVHLQVHAQTARFRKAPEGVTLPSWQFADWNGVPNHKRDPFAPLDIINTNTGERITHRQVLDGEPLPDTRWHDDGTGLFFTQQEHPDLPFDIYLSPWANLMGVRVHMYVGYIGGGDYHRFNLVTRYRKTPDPNLAHDATIALLRVAYDWPALEMNLHELRLSTTHLDPEYNVNRGDPKRHNGKYFYSAWSAAMVVEFLKTYDALFPYIEGNQMLADAVNRLIPWVHHPEDIIRMLDQRLVFATVRDHRRDIIRGGTVQEVAAEVLGPHEKTADLFDLTKQHSTIYPFTGTYQELYATALNRAGHYHCGSTGYGTGDAGQIVLKARAVKRAREAGLAMKMDLSDPERYPRVRSGADFVIDAWVGGGFWLTAGDASGGTHAGPVRLSRLKPMRATSEAAVELWGDPRHAWLLANLHGVQDPAILKLAEGQRDPVLHAVSRVLPSWAGILEMNSESTNLQEKTAAYMTITEGQGHAHSDFLDLNVFALGLPAAVDLAMRNEGKLWSRPAAAWSFMHNHAIAHGDEDPKFAGVQTGEPWLRAFQPPLMRGSYVDKDGATRLDRDVILMSVGDRHTYYAFDVQQLRGDALHTWCFHGIESHEMAINTPLREEVVRWTDRTLPERGDTPVLPPSQRIGEAPEVLQATWTATREERQYPHRFDGGGTVTTVALEPQVLGEQYDPALPEMHVRATLLGQAGATVLSAHAFSQPYNYAFPFLWVQSPARETPSVYPAIYEWYRGETPTIASARLLGRDPLIAEVTTASGQVDTYRLDGEALTVVSRDTQGIRFAQLSGGAELVVDGLRIVAATPGYRTPIATIDYAARVLGTADALPAMQGATIGNDGHRSFVHLDGEGGRRFRWRHDLQAHEGLVTNLVVLDDEHLRLETNQRLFHADYGNRKLSGYVLTSEDHAWQFRAMETGGCYRVIARPAGTALTEAAFADSNGDGLIHAKTFEIGLGDDVTLPADVALRRKADGSHEIRTNVPVEGQIADQPFKREPALDWQPLHP